MRLQIFSDIHLEFGHLNVPVTDADVVIAAGDIDQQTEGIEWLKSLNKPVIYVAGNHEIWGGDLRGSVEALRAACEGSNIHFLENNQITIGDVTFYGCTLWSDFAERDPEVLAYAKYYMNDFAYISLDGKMTRPDAVATCYDESVRWLKKALGRKSDKKQVVVTHHAPSLRSWGFDPEDPLRFAYCNQLDGLIRDSDIALWVHGHVHCSSSYRINGTHVVCNPRGYYKHNLVEGFQPGKIVEI